MSYVVLCGFVLYGIVPGCLVALCCSVTSCCVLYAVFCDALLHCVVIAVAVIAR